MEYPAISLKQQTQAYHEKVVAKGRKITTWVCPHCNSVLDTMQPEPNECSSKGYWDSLKRCYECNKPSFVAVHPNGETHVSALDIPAAVTH